MVKKNVKKNTNLWAVLVRKEKKTNKKQKCKRIKVNSIKVNDKISIIIHIKIHANKNK